MHEPVQPTRFAERRFHTAPARILGMLGGFGLVTSSLFLWWLASYADDLVEGGTDVAVDVIGYEQAATWLERAGNNLVGGRPETFRMFALVAAAAGVVAMLASIPRSPLARWPEWVWGTVAVVTLLPELVWEYWFGVWTFTGALVVGAAVVHYLARRDDLVRRAAAATAAGAKQAGVAAAPHVQSAAARLSRRPPQA
jgi:hypothetical protein